MKKSQSSRIQFGGKPAVKEKSDKECYRTQKGQTKQMKQRKYMYGIYIKMWATYCTYSNRNASHSHESLSHTHTHTHTQTKLLSKDNIYMHMYWSTIQSHACICARYRSGLFMSCPMQTLDPSFA